MRSAARPTAMIFPRANATAPSGMVARPSIGATQLARRIWVLVLLSATIVRVNSEREVAQSGALRRDAVTSVTVREGNELTVDLPLTLRQASTRPVLRVRACVAPSAAPARNGTRL